MAFSSATSMPARDWTASMVSHGHGASMLMGIRDLDQQMRNRDYRLILTLNVPEDECFLGELGQNLRERLTIIRNPNPLGFAANHNQALEHADSNYVLVVDPNIGLPMPIFEPIERILEDSSVGVVAPIAVGPSGHGEDNGRDVPTPAGILARYLLGKRHHRLTNPGAENLIVDWLAGLFLAMRRETFHGLKGFDDGYFLYCEDVEFCLRAQVELGKSSLLVPSLQITHAPNRNTLKRLEHFMWHLQSFRRLWRSSTYQNFTRNRNKSTR